MTGAAADNAAQRPGCAARRSRTKPPPPSSSTASIAAPRNRPVSTGGRANRLRSASAEGTGNCQLARTRTRRAPAVKMASSSAASRAPNHSRKAGAREGGAEPGPAEIVGMDEDEHGQRGETERRAHHPANLRRLGAAGKTAERRNTEAQGGEQAELSQQIERNHRRFRRLGGGQPQQGPEHRAGEGQPGQPPPGALPNQGQRRGGDDGEIKEQ